ncbi:MAG: ATP-binding cassette domain-containing protein [Ruminococcus sp.]|nr:ATP-binding cassette domain-containing protein [Ruminococcus sp.]
MEYALKTEDIFKSYCRASVLNGVTMSVPKGSVYGLVGRNGAGKTTLMRVVCGLQQPKSGSYSIFGVANNDRKISKVRSRIGGVIESPALYNEMTARDNIKAQLDMLGLPKNKADIDELLDIVGLGGTGKKRAAKFSLGMRQRLGIAVALAGYPDFIVLDEPINGLDPEGIVEIRELLLRLNKEKGMTVLISSHILSELSMLATHYGFMDKGKVIKEISSVELEQQIRKSMVAEVSDVSKATAVLDAIGKEYEVIADNKVRIFEKMSVTILSEELSSKGCELLGLTEMDESLESYFLDLVGGAEK